MFEFERNILKGKIYWSEMDNKQTEPTEIY